MIEPKPGPIRRKSISRRGSAIVLLFVALLLLVAACGGTSRNDRTLADSSGSSDVAASGDAIPEATLIANGGSADGGGTDAVAAPVGQPLGVTRSIISTANLTVRVDDRVVAARRTVQIAQQAGGLIFSQAAQYESQGVTTITLKVPPEKFESVLTDLAKLGKQLSQESSAQDVTDQVVDLQGRLATARASAERLRALLAEAPDVQGVVAVEGELTRRESEIESMEGRLRVIESQVDDATINLTLTETAAAVKVDDDIPGFASGLRSGWVAFRNIVAAIVAVVGFLLPFMIILLPAALLVRWGWRKRPAKVARPAQAPVWYSPQYGGAAQPPNPGGPADPAARPGPAPTPGSTLTEERPPVDDDSDGIDS